MSIGEPVSDYAYKALDFTRRNVSKGSSNISRSTILLENESFVEKMREQPIFGNRVLKELTQLDSNNSVLKKFNPSLNPGADKLQIQKTIIQIANFAIKNKVGNCQELSAVSYCYLRKTIKCPYRVEMFLGINFDHVFLVLNRPEWSSKEFFWSWSEDTIILDPWINCFFSPKKLPLFWKDVSRIYRWGNIYDLKVRPIFG